MKLADLIQPARFREFATAIPATFATVETSTPSSVAEIAIVAVATESPSMTALLNAAMHASDYWGDGEAARQDMREQCLAVPHNQLKDLIKHFLKTYPQPTGPR